MRGGLQRPFSYLENNTAPVLYLPVIFLTSLSCTYTCPKRLKYASLTVPHFHTHSKHRIKTLTGKSLSKLSTRLSFSAGHVPIQREHNTDRYDSSGPTDPCRSTRTATVLFTNIVPGNIYAPFGICVRLLMNLLFSSHNKFILEGADVSNSYLYIPLDSSLLMGHLLIGVERWNILNAFS